MDMNKIIKLVFNYMNNCECRKLTINDVEYFIIDDETKFELRNGCLYYCPKLFFKIKNLFGIDEHQDVIYIFNHWLKYRYNVKFDRYFWIF